jgi:hypothetical protein
MYSGKQPESERKALAQGSTQPRSRKNGIGRAPARSDQPPDINEAPVDHIVPSPVRQRGRPALPPEQGKRYPIGIRTTKVLRDALLNASRASGRSLAQEIEFRLERSFEIQGAADAITPLVARISDQLGHLAWFILTHNDADHLSGLLSLLEVDGLRATIERGMAEELPRSPDAGKRLTSHSRRRGSPEQDFVDELRRLRGDLERDKNERGRAPRRRRALGRHNDQKTTEPP